jgi:hypothetical protein
MKIRGGQRLPAGLVIATCLVGALVFGPTASATQPECRAVNQTKNIAYRADVYADPFGAAIAAADSGDTIKVIGTCRGNFYVNDKDLTLKGRKSDQRDVLDGGGSGTVLSTSGYGHHVVVSDLTITNGTTGVYFPFAGDTTLVRVRIVGNSGDGVYGANTRGTIEDSVVSGNGGSGIYIPSHGDLTVRNTEVTDNAGLGIVAFGGSEIASTTVARNRGGGILVDYGISVISGTAISGNTTQFSGGGIAIGSVMIRVRLTSSAVSGNTATGNGGGILALGHTNLLLEDSVIGGNTASLGGGIWKSSDTALQLIGASSVTGNTPDDIYTAP